MATKTKEQYSVEYRGLVTAVARWKKIVEGSGGPGQTRNLPPAERKKLQNAKENLKKSKKALQDFRSNLLDNVPQGGSIWQYITDKEAQILEDPQPRAPGVTPPPEMYSPPVTPVPDVNKGMPTRQEDKSAVYDPESGTYIETEAPAKPPDMFESEVAAQSYDEEVAEGAESYDEVKVIIEELLKNPPKFTEEAPNIYDKKYNTGDKQRDAQLFAADQAKYESALEIYLQESETFQTKVSGWLTYIDEFPDALSAFEKETVDRWKTKDEQWREEHDLNTKRWLGESKYNNDLIAVKWTELKDTRDYQQRSLDIEEIKAHIAAGELKLAAEKAAALNLRELRGQTLDFLEGIADNPEALASLMQSEYGQKMLSSLGFGALTEGDTPEDLSRFFAGRSRAGQGPTDAEGNLLTEEEAEGAMDILYAGGKPQKTEYDAEGNIVSETPAVPPGEQEQEQVHDKDGNPVFDEDGKPVMADRDPYREDMLYRRIRGQTGGSRFHSGNVRTPGTLIAPNARDWRNIVASGQSAQMIFEAALSGVGQKELMARIAASRPGAAIRKPQRVFNRSRFR